MKLDNFDAYVLVQNATEELERLGYAFDAVKKQLLGRLHDLARKQIGFESAPAPSKSDKRPMASALPQGHEHGHSDSQSHTGMPEVAHAVSVTFTDQG